MSLLGGCPRFRKDLVSREISHQRLAQQLQQHVHFLVDWMDTTTSHSVSQRLVECLLEGIDTVAAEGAMLVSEEMQVRLFFVDAGDFLWCDWPLIALPYCRCDDLSQNGESAVTWGPTQCRVDTPLEPATKWLDQCSHVSVRAAGETPVFRALETKEHSTTADLRSRSVHTERCGEREGRWLRGSTVPIRRCVLRSTSLRWL